MKFSVSHFFVFFATDIVLYRVSGLQVHAPNLTCFSCNSQTDTDCQALPANTSNIYTKTCKADEMFCMVTKVQYTLESEDMLRKFFSIERNCASKCDSGCIILGERNKIRFCRQCCRGSMCNKGSGAPNDTLLPERKLIASLVFVYLCQYIRRSG